MANRSHIETRPAPDRKEPLSELSSLENEGCLGCLECVKRDSCVYDVYGKRGYDPVRLREVGEALCVGCFRCVQECKKGILGRVRDPEFLAMGDAHWTPRLIVGIWKQARTGMIPVSGAGYRGPFAGPGFDSMWTDMSEIVRPTRDGIHGREHIGTSIELGGRPARLELDDAGALASDPPPFVELPIPFFFNVPDLGERGKRARRSVARAARMLDTAALGSSDDPDPRFAEVDYSADCLERILELKHKSEACVGIVDLPLDEKAAARAALLAARGAEVIHLRGSRIARGLGERKDAHLTDLVREIHGRLVDERSRERVTLLVSGGIAAPEHAAKIIACGADGAGADLALLAALECRLCLDCADRRDCPAELEKVPAQWGAQRIVNLMASWHAQLIEVLGAMGIREVRRLRGETGRAMFFEDLERESFGPIFGRRGGKRPGAPGPARPPAGGRASAACPSRFRNRLGKFRVVRTTACEGCGKCAEACPYGAHVRTSPMPAPKAWLCQGPESCLETGGPCSEACPNKALRVGPDPMWETLGDPRWTADLIGSVWHQAETGRTPAHLESRVGASGGGFDRMELAFPETPVAVDRGAIDLSVPLNRRHEDRHPLTIAMPFYGGGMSFGSISLNTMLARARAYKAAGSLMCTGEGGYPEELGEYDDHVITQVATGLFGVKEETIRRVRMVEFKYAQGAKPGLGGHLLGDKVTPVVAGIREAVVGNALFSPFPFHSVYSVEDHKKHVDWIRQTNPKAVISVKVSTPTDVDMVAVGSYYAGADIIHLDGSYGGTGAAPDIAKKNIAMPIEYAIPKVHRFLEEEGIRGGMTVVASGGLRTPHDVAKAVALGADAVVIGTAELVALECVRCGVCESGRGCPRGIATTDPELAELYGVEWAERRLTNLFGAWAGELRVILYGMGMESVRELVGRVDLLDHLDYEKSREPVRA